jgi:hypothetical protein
LRAIRQRLLSGAACMKRTRPRAIKVGKRPSGGVATYSLNPSGCFVPITSAVAGANFDFLNVPDTRVLCNYRGGTFSPRFSCRFLLYMPRPDHARRPRHFVVDCVWERLIWRALPRSTKLTRLAGSQRRKYLKELPFIRHSPWPFSGRKYWMGPEARRFRFTVLIPHFSWRTVPTRSSLAPPAASTVSCPA